MCQAIIIAGIDKYTAKKHWAKELADLKELVELKNQKKIKGFKPELYFNKINGIRLVGGLAGILAGVIIGSKMTDFVLQSDSIFSAMTMLNLLLSKWCSQLL